MQYHLRTLSLALAFAVAQSAFPSCERGCVSSGRLRCYSNGKVYQSDCHAKCARSWLNRVFTCDNDFDSCSRECVKCLEKQVCPSRPKPPASCESACPVYIRRNLICASDGKLYADSCRMKCTNKSLEQLFECEFPVNDSVCQGRCDRATMAPSPAPTQCSKRGAVCGYAGQVFASECHMMRKSTDELRFKCADKGYRSRRQCRKACGQYSRDGCLGNCSGDSQGWGCFADGVIRKDWCWAKCNGIQLKWPCKTSRRRCRNKCRKSTL